MNTLRLVIAGAKYHDWENEIIFIPHFTGEFLYVDCTRYMTMKQLKTRYNKEFIKQIIDDHITHENKKYYYAEHSPYKVTDDWDLLDDLSNLSVEGIQNI